MNTLAFGLSSLGTWDMVVILIIALLLFGKRLPEVGKSLGKGIVEFKKGLKNIEEDVENHSSSTTRQELPPQQPVYRAPLAEPGEDRRVSRADVIEQPMARDARTAGPNAG